MEAWRFVQPRKCMDFEPKIFMSVSKLGAMNAYCRAECPILSAVLELCPSSNAFEHIFINIWLTQNLQTLLL